MSTSPYQAKLHRERIERDIKAFFAQGNELKVIDHQMRKDALPYVIDGKKEYSGKNLPPIHERGCHG